MEGVGATDRDRSRPVESVVWTLEWALVRSPNHPLLSHASLTLENVRQDVYESCKMDIDKAAESTANSNSTAGGTVLLSMVYRRIATPPVTKTRRRRF